jgi:hypothetical protein
MDSQQDKRMQYKRVVKRQHMQLTRHWETDSFSALGSMHSESSTALRVEYQLIQQPSNSHVPEEASHGGRSTRDIHHTGLQDALLASKPQP